MQLLAEYVTKTINIEDEEITIKKLSMQDQLEINKIPDVMEKGIAVILKTVLRWSFKNTDGQPLAVTRENILRIRADLIAKLGLETMKYNINPKDESNG